MAQTGSRRRGRTATNSTDSDQPSNPKRRNTTKKKASSRSAKSRNQDTGAGDNGVQSAVMTVRQGRKGATDAIAHIRAKADEVLLSIEEETRRSHASRHDRSDDGLAGSLAAQYAMHSHDPITGCEAFEEAQRALQRFRSLAMRYEAVVRQDPGLAEPKWMRWKQDVLDLTALNGKARKVSRQIAEGHVAPTGWPGLADPPAGGGGGSEDLELSQLAAEIMEEAVPRGTATTWGAVAAQLVDAYGSMLKDTF